MTLEERLEELFRPFIGRTINEELYTDIREACWEAISKALYVRDVSNEIDRQERRLSLVLGVNLRKQVEIKPNDE